MDIISFSILAIVFLFQIISFSKTLRLVNKLKYFYPKSENLNTITDYDPISQYDKIVLNTDSGYDEFKKVIESTNNFLKRSKGSAADFNIIKDISERESDKIERAILSLIPSPIYIGLLGTMIGISISLWRITFPINDTSIQHLIQGASVAMLASASGILLTLICNSIVFKKAKYDRDELKNEYYTFLQNQLMPGLYKDMNNSLMNIRGVLDKFNEEFNVNFSHNIHTFKESISLISVNLQNQKEYLIELKKLKLTEIVKSNKEILDKISSTSTKLFDKIISTTDNLLETVDKTKAFFNELNAIAEQSKTLFTSMQRSTKSLIKTFDDVTGLKDKLSRIFEHTETNLERSNRLIEFLNSYYGDLQKIKIDSEILMKNLNNGIEKISNEYIGTLKSMNQTSLNDLNFSRNEFEEKIGVQMKHNLEFIEETRRINESFIENNILPVNLNIIKEEVNFIKVSVSNFNAIQETVKNNSGKIENMKSEIDTKLTEILNATKEKKKGFFAKLFGS